MTLIVATLKKEHTHVGYYDIHEAALNPKGNLMTREMEVIRFDPK